MTSRLSIFTVYVCMYVLTTPAFHIRRGDCVLALGEGRKRPPLLLAKSTRSIDKQTEVRNDDIQVAVLSSMPFGYATAANLSSLLVARRRCPLLRICCGLTLAPLLYIGSSKCTTIINLAVKQAILA